MTTRRRYVADPAVLSQPTTDTFQHGYPQEQHGYSQPIQQQQQQFAPPAEGQNAYAAPVKKFRVWDEDLEPPPSFAPPQGQQAAAAPYPLPPQNHIPQPPHAAGPSLRGPVPRIDPAQIPSPIEAAELDQNLYDQEDFESCNTKGLIPLASTDYRGIDQGKSWFNECIYYNDIKWEKLQATRFHDIFAHPYLKYPRHPPSSQALTSP